MITHEFNPNGSLDEIALKCGTDKASNYHDYCKSYQKYLPFSYESEINILEIGVQGGQSLKMWKAFFKNSKVTGIDINPYCATIKFPENVNVIIGSQNDETFLNTLPENFDLIIDDGSHLSYDIIYSFNHLFPKLNSGGVYIIEDLHPSYWQEYQLGNNAIEHFKGLVDDINFHGVKLKNNPFDCRNAKFLIEETPNATYFQKHIESILFFNSVCMVFKK